jgi:hypothetical protein
MHIKNLFMSRDGRRSSVHITRIGRIMCLIGIGLVPSIGPAHANLSLEASEVIEARTGNFDDNCMYKDITLVGKVRVVNHFPDIRVKIVPRWPDLKVKKVNSFARLCGEWQFVESFPDFTIQYVDSFPDIEIAWVESWPGMPLNTL